MLNSKEHYDLMDCFERTFCSPKSKPTMEPKEYWTKGNIYCDGHLNQLFLAYRDGYAYGKCCFQEVNIENDKEV